MTNYFQADEISIHAYDPEIDLDGGTYTPEGSLHDDDLASKVSGYSQTLGAEGNFVSCNMTFTGDIYYLDEWFDNGLNRTIIVFNRKLNKVFKGFVNKITYHVGGLAKVVGPVMEIANRVWVVYTPILDASSDPPIRGTLRETTIAEDTDSQEKYGIIELVISGGDQLDDGTTNNAEKLRDTRLEEMKYPKTSEDISIGETSDTAYIEIEVLGFNSRLSTYVYNTTNTGTTTISTKLEDVVDEDPNGLFTHDIDSNAWLTQAADYENNLASKVMNDLKELGDVDDNRYLIGVYGDEVVKYFQAPTTVEYNHYLSDEFIAITTVGGDVIDPIDIVAGVWSFFPDFQTGRGPHTDLEKDPRALFIETVTFSAPDSLQINGGKIYKVNQKLAKLTGVG